MILYAPAKINLGLHITARRPDGFHELQSLMMPIGLCDILELRPSAEGRGGAGSRGGTGAGSGGSDPPQAGLQFSQTGLSTGETPGENLCQKACRLMAAERELPPLRLHLHKQIPVGAGLGGGSSDASATLSGLNALLENAIPAERLHVLASELGSDCSFFLHAGPMLMEGRGERLSPANPDLRGWSVVVLFPEIHISTAEAYAAVSPKKPTVHLRELFALPPEEWRNRVFNDFEHSVFSAYPLLGELKEALYAAGALYASLSGSGSSLFGLFRGLPRLPRRLEDLVVWKGGI